MNLGNFFSFSLMLLVVSSISFAQDMPMKNNMMKDSSDKKLMMDKDKMTKDKDIMNKGMIKNNKMMHDDIMISKTEVGIAIKGYDPVVYFADGKAEMGMKKYSYEWGGATWYFTKKDHMMKFEKDPSKYAPQYGGHCEVGASAGHLADGDQTAWAIKDGKLYLNSNSDACKSFKMDYENKIMKADKNWKDGELKKGM